jgi:glycosyltransferase involved in cell wall biosynthesis
VIAAAAGGALETVLDGETGILAKLDDIDSFQQAIEGIDDLAFDADRAVKNADRFSVQAFKRRFSDEIAKALDSRTR